MYFDLKIEHLSTYFQPLTMVIQFYCIVKTNHKVQRSQMAHNVL